MVLPKNLLKSREGQLVLITIVFYVAVGIASPSFLSFESMDSIITDTAILMIMACAQMMVILTRGIDLTVAANIALSGMVSALIAMHLPGTPLILVMSAAVLTGLVLGMFNAVLIALLGIVITSYSIHYTKLYEFLREATVEFIYAEFMKSRSWIVTEDNWTVIIWEHFTVGSPHR